MYKTGTMKLQIIILSVCFLCVYASNARTLKKGQVAYKVQKDSEHGVHFKVTNGHFVIEAVTSSMSGDLTSCKVYFHDTKAMHLLKENGMRFEVIGKVKIQQMLKKCSLLQTLTRRAFVQDDNDTFNTDIVKGQPFLGDSKTGAPSGAGTHFAIFPGTKWCGYENVASSMQDLGIHNKTDACCRTHDHCPYYIDRFETKYHYFNHYPWTISHCDCDQHLFDCLKHVNTETSNAVGKLFFGLLDVQCITFKTGEYCANEKSVLSALWCPKKENGEMAILQQFSHKWAEGTVVG